ncbi:hypothetical protein [Metabacillus sp. B2-18]|uniref:hypothetical protein n=1 Tax=Metabacillus sp. B2-18 TaxID=2897333 RepID=UPI001E586C50|nr:hypothetical protein [Metabacillus sp. B2-18]UGB31677.1 hypothetical protein LPC09_04135 [Metabacillus sp. B2-18]
MQVLNILSQIWKSGANIYLDKKDDRIAIKDQHLIPSEVMQAAEENFQAIDDWFKSWKDESAEKITLQKMIYQICGWQKNDRLNDWYVADEDSLMMFIDWTVVLAKNGWKDLYEDHRQYENGESNEMARELYKRAVIYAKKGA